jgi:hypothetical protein
MVLTALDLDHRNCESDLLVLARHHVISMLDASFLHGGDADADTGTTTWPDRATMGRRRPGCAIAGSGGLEADLDRLFPTVLSHGFISSARSRTAVSPRSASSRGLPLSAWSSRKQLQPLPQ